MAVKRIIAHADGSPEGLARLSAAKRLAERFGAELEALLFCVLPDAPSILQDARLQLALSQQRTAALASLEEAEAATAALIAGPIRSVKAGWGHLRVETASAVRSADLVVVGPPAHDGLVAEDDVFHGALFGSGRPCLVLPRSTIIPEFGKRILIAWKDCREAVRAIYDALEFLQRADKVEVVSYREGNDQILHDKAAFDRIVASLKAHGITVEASLETGHGDAPHALLQRIAHSDADLVVMGGFGRSRVSEFLFGGVTRAMLRRMSTPILMSH